MVDIRGDTGLVQHGMLTSVGAIRCQFGEVVSYACPITQLLYNHGTQRCKNRNLAIEN